MSTPSSRTVHIAALDEAEAAAQLRRAFHAPLDLLLFFCTAAYDLDRLQAALTSTFADVPCVVGCTSAGQLGPGGLERGGLTAVGFFGGVVVATPFVIEPLATALEACDAIGHSVASQRRQRPGHGAFGLLLVDGLSRTEEQLTASLYAALGDVPIVGGSAGDDLAFKATHVYANGTFSADRAVFLLVETTLPFATFKFQHFIPTDVRLVVTDANPAERIISSFNGLPVVEGYAEALGLRPEEITAAVWSQHPLLVSIGGEPYIRSVKCLNADGSFQLLCAIERGVVLRIGASIDPANEATIDLDSLVVPELHVEVRRPQSPQEAQAMLELAAAYMTEHRPKDALPLLLAMRGSDFLTDRGHANLYWMIAESADGLDEAARLDAFGGFVVVSGLLPADFEQLDRRRRARAALLAHRVSNTHLGTSPDMPIVVPTARDVDVVVASLACGRDGDGTYIERRLPLGLRDDDAPRRLLCTENGDELVLWFEVEATEAR